MFNRSQQIFAGLLLVLVITGIGALWSTSRGTQAAIEISADESAPADLPQSPIALDAAQAIPMTVYLSPTCGCCEGWVEHISEMGFAVTLEYREDMNAVKEEFGIRPEHSSCHTALVNGYLVEGHVPGEVVRRLLAEAPPVRGISAPGMPIGSPGMESGDTREPYDVITFTSDGRTEVYSREGRN